MRILLTTVRMNNLSGAPLYNFELAKELKQFGHDVAILSDWVVKDSINGMMEFFEELNKANIRCLNYNDYNYSPGSPKELPQFDLIIASERELSIKPIQQLSNVPVINVIHSQLPPETPLDNSDQIIAYVCIRFEIMDHIINEHNIPKEKCYVIGNGIDRERFNPFTVEHMRFDEKDNRDYKKIIVPCTLDPYREKFLNAIIDSADEKNRIFIYGNDYGAKLHENEWAQINPTKFDIEKEIMDADEVHSIFLGRTVLEAWSCGINAVIWDPETLVHNTYPPPVDFDENYNVKNVTKKILSLLETLDDVTIVIPYYDQSDRLAQLLRDLRAIPRVIVAKYGSYAQGCNKGFDAIRNKNKTYETPYVIFINDDCRVPDINVIRQMVKKAKQGYDIVAPQINGSFCAFIWKEKISYYTNEPILGLIPVDKETDWKYPTGVCVLYRSELFDKLRFDERFKNGAEDIDIIIRAEKMGARFGKVDGMIHHTHPSSSTGRFDHLRYNENLFNTMYKGVYEIGP